LMQPFGVVGLALASSLGGVLYFWLTIRIFGTNKFLHILNNPKACIVLVIIILVEIAILKVFQAYENVFGILI
ncbi:MAG: lipid II flippase MurJ, partial [Helicobacter sp.]|nr:lipid II flippase MurJ [Helicobacter sp.]MDY5741256.1 lipid II flippase MurJ [Helicobacter sp.]